MGFIRWLIGFLGRAFLSIIFILSGVTKIFEWQHSELALSQALTELMGHVYSYPSIKTILEFGAEHTFLLLALAAGAEIVGGLSVFFGLSTRFGAFLLLLFLIPATLLFHSFWWMPETAKDLQMGMFLKNLSIAGGLLILLATKQKADSSSSRLETET